MKVLNVLGTASQIELASVMGKQRSGIGRTISSLEQKGYIERSPLNGTTNHVSLSKKGREMMPLIFELSESLTENAFKGFSQKRREATLKNLERIYQNLNVED